MKTILLCFLVFALALDVRAGDLDAPAAKPVTVRSEIQRGCGAASSADKEGISVDDFQAAIDALFNSNEQARNDTEAFKLGLCFGAWRKYWWDLSIGATLEGTGTHKTDVSGLMQIDAEIAHVGFRNWAKKLGLSDDQLKEVLGDLSYDAAQDEPAFEKALKTKQFKGSMPKR